MKEFLGEAGTLRREKAFFVLRGKFPGLFAADSDYSTTCQLPSADICVKLSKIKYSSKQIIGKRDRVLSSIRGMLQQSGFNTIWDGIYAPRQPHWVYNFFHSMFDMYDEVFFQRSLAPFLRERNCNVTGCFYARPKDTTAGYCVYGLPCLRPSTAVHLPLIIELSASILKTIKMLPDSLPSMGGLVCKDSLECMAMVFEHELIHALMFAFCPDCGNSPMYPPPRQGGDHYAEKLKAADCPGREFKGLPLTKANGPHGKTFMSLVNGIFGHTTHTHLLK